MSIIISLYEPITYLVSALDEYNKKNKKYPAVASRVMIRKLLIAVVEDRLSERLKWCKRTFTLQKLLREVAPWYDDHENTDASDTFHDMFVEPLVEQLFPYEEVFKYGPWDVMVTRRLGDDLLITNGGDYRIMDWEKRMSTGEWSLN